MTRLAAAAAAALVLVLAPLRAADASSSKETGAPGSWHALNRLSDMNAAETPAADAALPTASSVQTQQWTAAQGAQKGASAVAKPQLLRANQQQSGPVAPGADAAAAQTTAAQPDQAGPKDVTPWKDWVSKAGKLLLGATIALTAAGLLSWLAKRSVGFVAAALRAAAMVLDVAALAAGAAAAGIGVMIMARWGQLWQGGLLGVGGGIVAVMALKALAGDKSAGAKAKAGMKAASESTQKQAAQAIAPKLGNAAASKGMSGLAKGLIAAGAAGAVAVGALMLRPKPDNPLAALADSSASGAEGAQAAAGSTSASQGGAAAPSASSSSGSGAAALPPVPAGWDATKWNNPGYHDMKYDVGRVLAKYPHTPDGLRQALPEIQKEYPGTAIEGSDVLKFPDGTKVDVIVGAGEGGKAWAWQPVDASGSSAQAPAASGSAAAGADLPDRHRPATAGPVEGPTRDSHREYNSVVNGNSCYDAANILLLWQLWHCRRMNRVADNAVSCPNVPAVEQSKIQAIQARDCTTLKSMQDLEAKGVDAHCDGIVALYHDNLDWGEASMFFKGRYMNRCKPQWDVPGQADPWLSLTKCDPSLHLPANAVCSPPLPSH